MQSQTTVKSALFIFLSLITFSTSAYSIGLNLGRLGALAKSRLQSTTSTILYGRERRSCPGGNIVLGAGPKTLETNLSSPARPLAQVMLNFGTVFSNRLIPKDALPPQALKKTELLYTDRSDRFLGDFIDFHWAKRKISAIEPQKADEVFRQIKSLKDIPACDEGCDFRAHLIGDYLSQHGVYSEKRWARPVGSDILSPSDDPKVKWNFHVVNSIYVKTGADSFEERIIDTRLSDRLLTPKQWVGLMTPKGYVYESEFVAPTPSLANGPGVLLTLTPREVYLPYINPEPSEGLGFEPATPGWNPEANSRAARIHLNDIMKRLNMP